MSKIIEAVKATQTGKQIATDPLFDSLAIVKSEFKKNSDYHVGTEHRISVTLGTNVIINESQTIRENSGEIITEAMKQIRKQIAEAIFGEFRQDLYLINQAIWNRDFYAANQILNDLEKKMFEV